MRKNWEKILTVGNVHLVRALASAEGNVLKTLMKAFPDCYVNDNKKMGLEDLLRVVVLVSKDDHHLIEQMSTENGFTFKKVLLSSYEMGDTCCDEVSHIQSKHGINIPYIRTTNVQTGGIVKEYSQNVGDIKKILYHVLLNETTTSTEPPRSRITYTHTLMMVHHRTV